MSTALVDALLRLGVAHAFGVMGGAIAPFFHAVAHSDMTTLHLRHEAGAAFAAIEASLATRKPVLVFTTAGPGLTNAMTGMLAARWDGAHVIFVSAATSAANRDRVATQETSAATIAATACSSPAARSTSRTTSSIPPSSRRCSAGSPPGCSAPVASSPTSACRSTCSDAGALVATSDDRAARGAGPCADVVAPSTPRCSPPIRR